MTNGVTVELKELIALQRYVQKGRSQPNGFCSTSGRHLSKLRGRGMDFAEVRNYQAGDEIRHMEWRITARTGRPHIKLYQEEREQPVVILVDFSSSMFFGTRMAFKSVVAARLAALLAWTVMKQGDKVGGLLFSKDGHNEFTPRSREIGVLPLLAGLSGYANVYNEKTIDTTDEKKALRYALQRVRRVLRPGSTLVLISDFYNLDEEVEKHLSRLMNHNNILAYHICDALELAPPKPRPYAITDGQKSILLDTSVSAVNKAYQRYCETRMRSIEQQLEQLHIRHVKVTTDADLPLIVRQSFPKKVPYA